MSLPDSTQRRIDKLVDRDMFATEPQYHAQVQFMQRWLDMTKMAMEDEGFEGRIIERVLNRVVFGAPDPHDAYERIDTHQVMQEMAKRMPVNTQAVSDLINGPSGLVHGPHMTDQRESFRPDPPKWKYKHPGKSEH